MTLVQDLSPAATLPASEANLCAAWSDIGCALPGELYDGSDLFRFRSGLPSPFWNAVFRARLGTEAVDEQIAATLEYFGSHGLSMFWWLTSSSQPADLGTRLEAHGLSLSLTLQDMAADLRRVPDATSLPPTCEVVEIQTRDELARANRVVATSFGVADAIGEALTARLTQVGYGGDHRWHHFLGLVNGEPVASASMLLKHGVAGIYNVATVPDARRQGIGAAVTFTGLHAARARGYQVAILHATEMGLPMYRRLGFEERHPIRLYLWSAPAKPSV